MAPPRQRDPADEDEEVKDGKAGDLEEQELLEKMAELVEEMVCQLAEKFSGGLKIETKNDDGEVTKTIDLSRPWKRAPYRDLSKGSTGDEWFDLGDD